jgi:acyl transferase domain-containing protein
VILRPHSQRIKRLLTCSKAVCAASNLIYSPENLITLSNMNFLSPDGKCFSFDHRGNGYAKGEGFATLVLKPLSQALTNGDSIRALIRSTGTNQDGHTPGGITQPSRELQSKLIKETYQKAGLRMSQTRIFEAHGKTPDALFVEASLSSFKRNRNCSRRSHRSQSYWREF